MEKVSNSDRPWKTFRHNGQWGRARWIVLQLLCKRSEAYSFPVKPLYAQSCAPLLHGMG